MFVLDVIDGRIPSDLGVGTTDQLEEERRLLYVAMTRVVRARSETPNDRTTSGPVVDVASRLRAMW